MSNLSAVPFESDEQLQAVADEMKQFARDNRIYDYNAWVQELKEPVPNAKTELIGEFVRTKGSEVHPSFAKYSRLFKNDIFNQYFVSYFEVQQEGRIIGQVNISSPLQIPLQEDVLSLFAGLFLDLDRDVSIPDGPPPHVSILIQDLKE